MNKLYPVLLLTSFPTILFAHGAHGSGIMTGITHPIFGIDHNIAIISAAIIGYMTHKTKWFCLPSIFIMTMIIGGLIGIGNEATPLIEKIIASSVLIHGILIAINRKIPIQVLYLLIAIFGFVHGYAHGAEMPDDNTALQYISGYVIGTILLSILGVLISKSTNISSSPSSYSKTLLGGIVIGCGIILLLP